MIVTVIINGEIVNELDEAFNVERRIEDKRKWQCKLIEQDRNRQMSQKYGITREQFTSMFLRQLGMCGICSVGLSGETRNLTPHIDHCHKTGKVRGLLCSSCNQGIGRLKDSHENCQKAVEWLKRA